MLTISEAILHSDLGRIPKDCLIGICGELNLDQTGAANLLIDRILNAAERSQALEKHSNRLFCGKTSVTWFHLSSGASLLGAKGKIISKSDFNPFEELRVPPQEELSATPKLIAAIQGDNQHSYYLRFMYKARTENYYYGLQKMAAPISDVVTVYIDEENQYIEVRSGGVNAKKVAAKVADLISQSITLEQTSLIPNATNLDAFAESLGGSVIETVGRPEGTINKLSPEEAASVCNILNAVDNYFNNQDTAELVREIEAARVVLGDCCPISQIVLAGLDRVGLGCETDLRRGNPLYDLLKPHVQQQTGYIKFEYPNTKALHTIRVGLTTNSIQFMTHATENVIKYVRDRVIII